MPDKPLAYFFTWTTKGSWLHGDDRGSWQAIRGSSRATFLAPKNTIDPQSPPGVILSDSARTCVQDAISNVCQRRSWPLLAINVRSNHAHAVIDTHETPPEQTMQQLKAWSTRALRDAGELGPSEPLWTRHGSTRYLWTPGQVERAITYVRDHQDGERFT